MSKKLLLGAGVALALGGTAAAEEVKIGVLLGFTGPIETLTPGMADGAELALKEVSTSGALLNGVTLTPVRADSTCADAAAATAAAERLVTVDNVAAIMGADCSGVTTAVANSVAIPNGVTIISPSATSPALTEIEDNGYFFRTAPSDARQGEVLAEIVMEKGVETIAVTYTNNDYGKGLADSFAAAYEARGGSVAISASHEDGKGDYSAEVAALSASGAEVLAVFGYVDQGGRGVIRSSLDSGAFETFVLADGMIGESLFEEFGSDLDGSFGTRPGTTSDATQTFLNLAKGSGFDGDGPYRAESYDAAALIALAMQAAGSTDRAAIKSQVMGVANAPGEKIGAGQLAKGLEILAGGGEIDYQGATDVEFTDVGEAAGSYLYLTIENAAFETTGVR